MAHASLVPMALVALVPLALLHLTAAPLDCSIGRTAAPLDCCAIGMGSPLVPVVSLALQTRTVRNAVLSPLALVPLISLAPLALVPLALCRSMMRTAAPLDCCPIGMGSLLVPLVRLLDHAARATLVDPGALVARRLLQERSACILG